MNPTGHTTADMIFTGFLLVIHLAALAGLGYILGRIRASRELDAAEDQRDRLTKQLDAEKERADDAEDGRQYWMREALERTDGDDASMEVRRLAAEVVRLQAGADDVAVIVRAQAAADHQATISGLTAEVERLRRLLGRQNPEQCPACGEIREAEELQPGRYCPACGADDEERANMARET